MIQFPLRISVTQEIIEKHDTMSNSQGIGALAILEFFPGCVVRWGSDSGVAVIEDQLYHLSSSPVNLMRIDMPIKVLINQSL